MIGLDTNVLVGYIAQDDEKQTKQAAALIDSLSDKKPGFVTLISIIELTWVMQSCYKASKTKIVAILQELLHTREIIIENADIVLEALHVYSQSNADFSDCLIERSAHYAHCVCTMTFDSKAAKTAGMHLIDM